VYSDGLSHPSIVELARAGNLQAIAHWLNQGLMPYGIRAYVGVGHPGCLKVLVELQPLPPQNKQVKPLSEGVVRLICHRIWELNSARIEGLRIIAQFRGESTILWERSVRVISPSRRKQQQHSHQLRSKVQQVSQRKTRMKTTRSLVMGGPAVAAFVVGGVLGYAKAPVDQTNAVAVSQPKSDHNPTTPRPKTVQAALEMVPVVNHDQVANPNDPTVTLMFAGDVTLSDYFAEAVGKNYSHSFTKMNESRQADLAMVNLDNPLTRATLPMAGKQVNFKADPDSVRVLKNGGIGLVTLANNHTMDYQSAGLDETVTTLDRAGILHIGAGKTSTEARRPAIIDVKGKRIAYLAYYGEEYAASNQTSGTNPIQEDQIAQDIRAIRKQVDWVVVNYHWGQELADHPADWQVALAHFTIDQGADVVVGHHPHVLQGAEIYKGRPIAYSMGNFIFGGNSRKDYDTAILRVALKDQQMKVEFLPVEVRDYEPTVVEGDRGLSILQQITTLSADFKQPMKTPVILNASVIPSTTPSLPVFNSPAPTMPSDLVSPVISPSSSTNPQTPIDPAVNSGEAVPPGSLPGAAGDSVISPSPTTNPLDLQRPTDSVPPASPVPGSTDVTESPDSQMPQNFTNPADSFTNSPNRTSIQQFAPPSSDRQGYFSSPDPVGDPTSQPIPSSTGQPTSMVNPASKSTAASWSKPGQVGAALIPDVSLLAATIW
jgi:poly-gamma-glutamate synthesis protein (capsule biosynthesis protein)